MENLNTFYCNINRVINNKILIFLYTLFEITRNKCSSENLFRIWSFDECLENKMNTGSDFFYFADYDFCLCFYCINRHEENGAVYVNTSGLITQCATDIVDFSKKLVNNHPDLQILI
jgi:hypothetical protein